MHMMTIRKTLLLLQLVLGMLSVAWAQPQPRQHLNFDENWRFHFGNAADPSKDFNFGIANVFAKSGDGETTPVNPKFNDSTWRQLSLPHDWAVELPFAQSTDDHVMMHGYKPVGALFPETSIGWYRKTFMLTPADSGSRYSIQFDGIYRDAMVWINGYYLGTNLSGYSGVTYDITDFVDFHSKNVITVRVDATQYEGWFYEGAGIYRHVWLNRYENVHIAADDLFIWTQQKGNTADFDIRTSVDNEGLMDRQVTLKAFVLDRNGKRLAASKPTTLTIPAANSKEITEMVSLASPHLWNLDDPYLYKVEVELSIGGAAVDKIRKRIGVRTFTISAQKGLFMNGQHIKLQGVCCHQDHAGVGSALPDYLQYYRIRLLKEMGANAYRTSHNPPTPELLDACDSLGMLVLDENRLLNSSPEYVSQFKRQILRDRNHPSVFMWSIGNEEWHTQSTGIGKRMAMSLIAEEELLDPTRTCTYACDLANVYQGINSVIPVRGFNYRQYAAAAYHKDHPDQPMMGSEMGSTVTTRGIYRVDSLAGYVPDEDSQAPPWATTAETWWTLAANNDWWMGGFVWTGFDYRGEPTPYEWPDINSNFGIMDMCGFPKNIYYYYQSWWSDKDVIHISPHWNWKGREGDTIQVWVNSNAQKVELRLNGKSLGTQEMKPNSHLTWNVAYEPGTLEAVGTRDGRVITTKVETTGDPYKIVLTPDKNKLLANGQDATVVNVTVVDKEGREVPDANMPLDFHLSGPGAIIGSGNGDPSNHEADKQGSTSCRRSMFNGKCQLIIQAGSKPGSLKINASGSDLRSEVITVAVGG